MSYVVVNSEGDLYGGFSDGKPVWFKTKREPCMLENDIADKVVKQLTELGMGPVTKRLEVDVKRKWVRKDYDAAAS